jgi:type I restriction enzyme S subunit
VDVAILRPAIAGLSHSYITHALNSPSFLSNVLKYTAGSTRNRLSRGNLSQLPIPLPPLAEQHRIVAKVDELMALSDRLEAAQAERERRRDRLAAASLHRLNTATDPDAFRAAARYHLRHLPRMTTRQDQIAQLLQTVLGLAIRRALVPQDPGDESAKALLERIRIEKAALGKPREREAATSIRESSAGAFEIPASWRWATLGDFVLEADAGWSPRAESFPRSGENWGVLKVSAVSWDEFLPDQNKQLLSGAVPRRASQVHAGDFLISRANTAELVAKCVIVEEEPTNLIMSDKIVRLSLTRHVNGRFIVIVNNHAEYARAYYAEQASGRACR